MGDNFAAVFQKKIFNFRENKMNSLDLAKVMIDFAKNFPHMTIQEVYVWKNKVEIHYVPEYDQSSERKLVFYDIYASMFEHFN